MAWLGTWEKRIEITINNTNVDSDLTDFPISLYLSASSGVGNNDISAIFDELISDANRKKIAVTSSDGTTQLYVEIEKWDDASEVAWLWVKIPAVASGATTILYIYYDSAQSDNTTYVGDIGSIPGQTVWDSNFKLVYHMSQDPNGDAAEAIKDSTSNLNHGTPAGTMTTADLVDGAIGNGIDFDGVDDNIGVSITRLTDAGTIEIICKETGTVANYDSCIGASSSGTTGDICIEADSNTTLRLWLYNVGGTSNITVDYTNWCHVACTLINSADCKLWEFVSGNSLIYSNVNNAIGANLEIGDADIFNSNWPGIIDEVRISSIKRSDAWLKASYYSNDDNLVSFGAEEGIAVTTIITLISPLEMTIGIGGETSFIMISTGFLSMNLGFNTPLMRYVGRELLSLRSIITKVHSESSSVEKIMDKQSRITKLYEHTSTLR